MGNVSGSTTKVEYNLDGLKNLNKYKQNKTLSYELSKIAEQEAVETEEMIGPQLENSNVTYGPVDLRKVYGPVDERNKVNTNFVVPATNQYIKGTVGFGSTVAKYGINKQKVSNFDDNYENFNITKADAYASEQTTKLLAELENNALKTGDAENIEFWNKRINDKDFKMQAYTAFREIYNENTHAINEIDSQIAKVNEEWSDELTGITGYKEEVKAINDKYTSKIQELEEQRLIHVKEIVGEDGDPSKFKPEKEYFGNTGSQISSYASSSIFTALLSFSMKEGSTYLTTLISDLKAGKKVGESFEHASDDAIKALPKSGVEAGSQGLGYFMGMVLSKGNVSWGGAAGTVATNFTSLGYDLFNADSKEARNQILDARLGETVWSSGGAVASAPIPFISGNSGAVAGKDINAVIGYVKDYDSFGEFAGNVSGGEIGSRILETTGAAIGDVIEYRLFGKTTGLLSAGLSTAGSWGGNKLGTLGENLGYVSYDFVHEKVIPAAQTTRDFAQYVKDTNGKGFGECWKCGASEIAMMYKESEFSHNLNDFGDSVKTNFSNAIDNAGDSLEDFSNDVYDNITDFFNI